MGDVVVHAPAVGPMAAWEVRTFGVDPFARTAVAAGGRKIVADPAAGGRKIGVVIVTAIVIEKIETAVVIKAEREKTAVKAEIAISVTKIATGTRKTEVEVVIVEIAAATRRRARAVGIETARTGTE